MCRTVLGTYLFFLTNRPEPGVPRSYIQKNSEPVGDAGDQYTGLDRFGCVVDQCWRKGNTDLDRFQYGYDRDSNRLY